MKRAARLIAVLDLLAETGEANVEDIVAKFDVSAATARRDLDTARSGSRSPMTCPSATSRSCTRKRSC
jgi:DeoR family transcriptional regulator of aga operon